MKFLKWELPKSVKVIVNITLVAVLLSAVIALNIVVQRSSNNKSAAKQRERLNVAIVNEDKTIAEKDKRYNLGANYIKTIERDNSQNWTVASRSTAEAGLKKGNYQLAIYIPSNFSAKILDINSVIADKAMITYKVNAKGNTRVEAAANAVGRDVVSDLNSQLVNMYLASILGNLYTAQQNAQTISKIQNNNIGNYSGNLLKSATAFPSTFPALASLADGSSSLHSKFAEKLNSDANKANLDRIDSSGLLGDLRTLISDYSKGNLSSKDYTKDLMAINPKNLSAQISNMIAVLEGDQKGIDALLKGKEPNGQEDNSPSDDKTLNDGTSNLETDQSKAYKELTEDLNSQLDGLEEQLEAVVKKDEENPNIKSVKTLVEEELARYYGKKLDTLDTITVADVLMGENNGLSTDLERYRTSVNSMVSNSVSLLPADKAADLSADLKGVTATDYLSKIRQYSDANPASKYHYTSANTDLLTRLHHAAEDVRHYNTDDVKATAKTNTAVAASLRVTGDVKVESWYVVTDGQASAPVSPSETINVDLSKKNEFHYNIKTASSEGNVQNDEDNSSHQSSASIQVNLGNVTSTEAKSFNLADYSSKVEKYAAAAQEAVGAYNTAGNLLRIYYPDGSQENLTDSFFKQSAKTLLTNLLTQAVENSVNTYSANRDVNKTLQNLRSTREKLVKNMEKIQQTNEKLKKDIDDTLGRFKAVYGDAQDGKTGSQELSKDSSSAKDKSGKFSGLSSKISKLISQSESLKTSAASNAKAASSVSSSFASFNKAAKTAESDSKKMSADAQELMKKFRVELAQSNDFVKSFVSVLDKAYKNGVPNEALLEFLSSPVASRTSSYKSKVNTYRPFTWVLLLAVISLFTAYLFAVQDLIKRVKNKFIKGLLTNTDPLNVGALSALALVEGLVLGIISSRSMNLDRDMVPSWILLFVLCSFLLLHGQYFLLKHMKALGMGLSLYNLVSFVYFSNAVGTTVATADLAQKLKKWNILTFMETKLTLYFDHIAVDAKLILLLFAFAVIMIICNMFIRFPWENQTYQTKMIED